MTTDVLKFKWQTQKFTTANYDKIDEKYLAEFAGDVAQTIEDNAGPGGTSSGSVNDQNSLFKAYRVLTTQQWLDNGSFGQAFDTMDYSKCCINTVVEIETYIIPGQPTIRNQKMVAVYDPTAPADHKVHVDGSFRKGDLVPAKFVTIDSNEAKYGYVRRDTNPVSITDWHIGELSIWSINGQDVFATAKKDGGTFPAFTGVEDTNWKPAAAPAPPTPSLLATDNTWTGANWFTKGIGFAPAGQQADVGLARSSAGVLEVNTGTAGSPATLTTLDTVFQVAPPALNSGSKIANAFAPYLGSGNTVTNGNLAVGGSGQTANGVGNIIGASIASTNSAEYVAGLGLLVATVPRGLQPGVATNQLHLKSQAGRTAFASLSIGTAGGLIAAYNYTSPAGNVPIVTRFRGAYATGIAIDFGDTFNYQGGIYTSLAGTSAAANTAFTAITWLPWYITGGSSTGVATPSGTVLTFTQHAEYAPIYSGTFTVDLTGATVGVVVKAELGPAATQPVLDPAKFDLVGPGTYQAGKRLGYGFCVAASGKIEYFIYLKP